VSSLRTASCGAICRIGVTYCLVDVNGTVLGEYEGGFWGRSCGPGNNEERRGRELQAGAKRGEVEALLRVRSPWIVHLGQVLTPVNQLPLDI